MDKENHLLKRIQSKIEIIIRFSKGRINVSPWIDDPQVSHCSMRIVEGGDPNKISDRVAFIGIIPRVRTNKFTKIYDFENWFFGPKGSTDYGKDKESRNWCDRELRRLGYRLPEDK